MTPAMKRLERQLVAAVTQAKPRVPEAGRLLWSSFGDLHRSRDYGMAGPEPISHAEIEAFARVHRLPLAPAHVAILRAMDDAWLLKVRRAEDRGEGSDDKTAKSVPRTSTHALTPQLFDAVT